MPTAIAVVGSYLPQRVVTNDELANQLDTSDEWIREHTGIEARHVADPSQCCSDLAYAASVDALQRAGMSARELQLIIVATTSPDYPNFPSTACCLQSKLGTENCPAFDIFAACSGFVYALGIARSMIESRLCNNALVVGAEMISRFVDWSDRKTCVLFGDGAGAAILRRSSQEGILDVVLYADGSQSDCLLVPGGGTKLPFQQCKPSDFFLKMNGRGVYDFAVKSVRDVISKILTRNNISWEDLRYIVPHQANLRIIQAVAKREGIPVEKFYMNIDKYANTSSASIPIALAELEKKKLLSEGDLVLLAGFGAGVTWAGALVRWSSFP